MVQIWDFATESVGDILECADIAVEAIVDRAEQQVMDDVAAAAERAAAETALRRAQLDRLRRELGSRASTLAFAYAEIVAELEAVDRVLAGLDHSSDESTLPAGGTRVTVRERHTYHFAGEVPPAEDDPARPPVRDAVVPWQDAA
jgi:hypothetical protein